MGRNFTTTSTFRIAALLFVTWALTACGASVKSRGSDNNGTYYPPGTNLPSTGGSPGTQCNSFDSSSTRLAGRVTTHYANGTMSNDKVRLRITGLNESFGNSSSLHIKFFRWQASDAGVVQLDSTPLSFIVERGTSSSSPISTSKTSFSVNDVTSLRASAAIPGTTVEEFLANTLFVVSGVDYSWDAMKVVLYDGASVVGQADFLLPIFDANPNEYAADHPSVLNGLHPFWNERNQALSTDQWVARAHGTCF